jgi:hypothetical protein
VSFFDDSPLPQRPPTPEPRREPWRGTPEDTLGIPVAFAEVLARSEEVAVLVGGIVAFPAGFSLSLILLSRLNPSRQPFAPFVHRHPAMPEEDGPFRFGIGFANGTKVFAERGSWPLAPQSGYTLRPQGGGGGGRSWRQGFFIQPLPPAGPLHLVCEWPSYNIPESRLELDATIILEAAERAKPVWPDDVGLPEPPDRPRFPGAMSSSPYGSWMGIAGARREPERRRPETSP